MTYTVTTAKLADGDLHLRCSCMVEPDPQKGVGGDPDVVYGTDRLFTVDKAMAEFTALHRARHQAQATTQELTRFLGRAIG